MRPENAELEFLESLRVARGITVWTLGTSAQMLDPHTDSGVYAGPIIGETRYHTIQRIAAQSAVAHAKHLLDEPPTVGEAVRIHYSNELGIVQQWRDRSNEKQNRSGRVPGQPAHAARSGIGDLGGQCA